MTIEETIIGVLRHYRQTEVCDENGDGYPLIDALTLEGHGIDMGIREIEIIADTIADALRREREPVKIKPLVWETDGSDALVADVYRIGINYGLTSHQFWLLYRDYAIATANDHDALKAAAQADYEARILSALEPDQTAPPPFARLQERRDDR